MLRLSYCYNYLHTYCKSLFLLAKHNIQTHTIYSTLLLHINPITLKYIFILILLQILYFRNYYITSIPTATLHLYLNYYINNLSNTYLNCTNKNNILSQYAVSHPFTSVSYLQTYYTTYKFINYLLFIFKYKRMMNTLIKANYPNMYMSIHKRNENTSCKHIKQCTLIPSTSIDTLQNG